MALLAVIAIVRGGRAPLAGGRIHPRRRIQYERGVRIEAAAVEIVRKQRPAWHAVGKSSPEEQRAEIVLGQRREDRQPARVVENGANLPILHYAGQHLVAAPFGERVVEGNDV